MRTIIKSGIADESVVEQVSLTGAVIDVYSPAIAGAVFTENAIFNLTITPGVAVKNSASSSGGVCSVAMKNYPTKKVLAVVIKTDRATVATRNPVA